MKKVVLYILLHGSLSITIYRRLSISRQHVHVYSAWYAVGAQYSGNINIRRCIFQSMVVNEPVIILLSMASTAITNCSLIFQYIESGNIVNAESSDNIYTSESIFDFKGITVNNSGLLLTLASTGATVITRVHFKITQSTLVE